MIQIKHQAFRPWCSYLSYSNTGRNYSERWCATLLTLFASMHSCQLFCL